MKNTRILLLWKRDIEWPTVFIMAGVYTAFFLLSAFFHELPGWLVFIAAGYTLALFNSLQHEVIHHHPTPWQGVNEALVFPALTLFSPFAIYKRTHLKHHNNHNLTNPERDPESYYMPAQRWQTLKSWQQSYYRGLNTFVGRLLWGPVHFNGVFLSTQAKKLMDGDYTNLRIWLVHLCSVALVLTWFIAICGISLLEYIFFFVYPALSLTLMRSFLEHQSLEDPAHRSAIVESNKLLSLMFLNNNLHAIHHDNPNMPWYKISHHWRENREAVLQKNDHYFYRGYWDIVKEYALRAKENPAHALRPKPQPGL